MTKKVKNTVVKSNILFEKIILNELRNTIGKTPHEKGGLIGCSCDDELIDSFWYDKKSVTTSVSYSYDVETMSVKYNEWKEKGIKSFGIIHSHPPKAKTPSLSDIATGYELMKFFRQDFFYMPIVLPEKKGRFTMYFYVLRKMDDDSLEVILEYVLRAKSATDEYEMLSFDRWERQFLTKNLEAYYQSENGERENGESEYFQRVEGVVPEKVLDKTIVCIGIGGARSLIENFARSGYHNYMIMDGDKVSATNIATQHVYRSEIGMYKTEALKKRIHEINPAANVLSVNRFLDDSYTDEEFENNLRQFPGKKPTDFLILGMCDDFYGNDRASKLALKLGIPYIGGAMYQQGMGAEAIFIYPGVTPACPRCMLRSRYEAYEEGYENEVTSKGCLPFFTDRLNALLGFIAMLMLMYHDAPGSLYNDLLDRVKEQNFVQIRMNPFLKSELGIGLFDKVFSTPELSKYTFTDETLWLPQHPDSEKYGEKTCKLCGGVGNFRQLKYKWRDTRHERVCEWNR